jgi:hypothetical protein
MVNVHEHLRFASPLWSRYQSESSDATEMSSARDSYASESYAQQRQLQYCSSSREGSPAAQPQLHLGARNRHSSSQASSAGSANSGNERSVRSMLDGFIASTFLSCVHQPITSCVSGEASNDWDYKYDESLYGSSSRRSKHARRMRSDSSFVSPARSPTSCGESFLPAVAAACDSGASREAAVTTPGEHDVVCGKGGSRVRHPGNERFRDLCRANRPTYATLTKKQKIVMARQIVLMVQSTQPPGQFLARNPHSGLWEDVGLERSLEKAAQALRDRSSNNQEGSDPEERAPGDIPLSPVPSVISSTASSSIRTPKSSTGRTAPTPQPRIQIPAHLRSVFRPVVQERSPPLPSPLHTPVLAESPAQATPTRTRHSNHPPPYVSPADRHHRYRSLRGVGTSEGPATSRIAPERHGEYGLLHREDVRDAKHTWSATPLPALPDAPDDELMFSCSPLSQASTSNTHSIMMDPDGGWLRHHHQPSHHQIRGCEPDGEFPDDEDMVAPSLVSSSTPTFASSSLVSSSWSGLDGNDDGTYDDGRTRRPLPLFSPSSLLQSRGHHIQSRRSRPLPIHDTFDSMYAQKGPQPPATFSGCGAEYDSDTSMDGGTALSTALFLRLDEPEE